MIKSSIDWFNSFNYFSEFQASPEMKLQKAIGEGNAKLIDELAKKNLLLVSKSLPNGELPLNYAIRQSKIGSVEVLLKNGANPLTFDDQKLNAFGTAYFKKDYALIEHLLFKEILRIAEEWKDFSSDSKYADQLKNIQNSLKDCNGLNVYHYGAAVYGDFGIKITQEGKLDISSLIIEDNKNNNHSERIFELAKMLNDQSPFQINRWDIAGFSMLLIYEAGRLLSGNVFNSNIMNTLYITHFLVNVLAYMVNNKSDNNAMLSLLTLSAFQGVFHNIPSVRVACNALIIPSLAYRIFQGFKVCLRNFSLDPAKSVFKAVIVQTPKVALLRHFSWQAWTSGFSSLEADLDGDNSAPCNNDNTCRSRVAHMREVCQNETLDGSECNNAKKYVKNLFEFRDIAEIPLCPIPVTAECTSMRDLVIQKFSNKLLMNFNPKEEDKFLQLYKAFKNYLQGVSDFKNKAF